jgi:hypothetical protein
MSLTSSDKREIESIIKNEIKSFLGSNTVKQLEDKLVERIQKEVKNGKISGDVKDVMLKLFKKFYENMYMNYSYIESKLRN